MKIANIVGTRPNMSNWRLYCAPSYLAMTYLLLTQIPGNTTMKPCQTFLQKLWASNGEPKSSPWHSSFDPIGRYDDKIGQWLEIEKPQYVLVFGDTNSTLAAACALPTGEFLLAMSKRVFALA